MKDLVNKLIIGVRSELRTVHAGNVLGVLWLVLVPLIQVLMYVFLFQVVWKLRISVSEERSVGFVWYLISAYLPIWAFQDALSRAVVGLTANAHVIRSTMFSPWVFVVSRVVMVYSVLVVICIPIWLILSNTEIYNIEYIDSFILLSVLLCQMMFTVGLALLLASFGVLMRDLTNIVSPLLMGLVLTAPVLYPLDNVPEALRVFLWINPLTQYAEAYHILLLTDARIGAFHAFGILGGAIISMILGIWAYRKIECELPDLL